MKIIQNIALVAALMPGSAAFAATSVVEAIAASGGDYENSPAATNDNVNQTASGRIPTPNGAVVWTGSMRFNCSANDTCTEADFNLDPSDAFFFDVSPYQKVTDIFLSYDTATLSLSGIAALSFSIMIDDDLTVAGQVLNSRLTGAPNLVPLISSPNALGSGTYNFFIGSYSTADEDFVEDINWRVDATFAPIPLPGSAPILLAGIGAFAFMRRQKC